MQPLSTFKIAQVKPSNLLPIHWSSSILWNSTRGNVKRTICKFWQQAICKIVVDHPRHFPQKKLTGWNTPRKEEKDASDSGTTSAPSFSQKFSTKNAPFACFQGTCNRGSDCTFAHGSEDMQVDGWKPTERLVDFVNH